MRAELPLHGLTLVVTRPSGQGARTAAALRGAGADVIEFPVLEISPVEASIAPSDLARATGIIFVSANAVTYGVPVLRRAGAIADSVQIFAIGRATATALVGAAFKDVVSPQQSIDSEGLLALSQLHTVEGRHIILVKGHSELGGRTVLEQTLTKRGAYVTVLDCYRRAPLVPDRTTREVFRNLLLTGRVHACFALSVETLESLMNIFSIMNISPQPEMVLLVPHRRVADAARTRGFDRIAEVPLADPALITVLANLKSKLLNPLTS